MYSYNFYLFQFLNCIYNATFQATSHLSPDHKSCSAWCKPSTTLLCVSRQLTLCHLQITLMIGESGEEHKRVNDVGSSVIDPHPLPSVRTITELELDDATLSSDITEGGALDLSLLNCAMSRISVCFCCASRTSRLRYVAAFNYSNAYMSIPKFGRCRVSGVSAE